MTASFNAATFGFWKPSSSFAGSVTAGPATFTTGNGLNGYTIRILIAASAISTSGSNVRLTFRSSNIVAPFTVAGVYIGEKAGSGDAYDTTAMTEVKFGGASGFTIATTSTDKASDITPFTLDETKSYVVAYRCTSGGNCVAEGPSLPAGWTTYYRSGTSEEGTANAIPGYTLDSRVWGLKQIEV